MKRTKLTILLILILLVSHAQESAIADLFNVSYETPLTIEIAQLSEKDESDPIPEDNKKKKKPNPKIYYGIKGKKGFTKNGFGKNVVLELFYYLKPKDFEGSGEFDRDFYYYDFKRKKIVNSLQIKPGQKVGVVHGHYIKKMGDQVLQEGYFYKGKKHKRWVRYNRHDILQEKEVYWKGWTQESLLGFYDFKRTQLREVIPIHYGDRQGTYYAFHPDGRVAATGKYKFDQKVGYWREYYPNRRLKREIKYPDEPFNKKVKPVVSKEWDESGKIIYDRKKYLSGRR